MDVRGGVRCWGLNGSGQLGNDSETDSNDPEVVVDGDGSSSPLLGVVQVAAGRGHTCALMEKAGAVKCWGVGARGRLGDGGNAKKDHPVDVVGVGGTGTLSGIVQLDAGDNHTCAVTGEGGVVCWGIGDNGRLGNNAVADSASPVKVVEGSAPLTGIVQVSAGIEHACALTNQGGIVCWGKGQNGQFGNGTNPTGQRTAVSALVSSTDQSPLSGAVQVSVGGYRTCALMSNNGGVKCWGTDTYGELGNVGTGQQKYPVNVTDAGGTALTGMVGVSAGREHTCAVAMGGGVKCWGRGVQGQIGNGVESNQDHPVDVVGSELFIALAGSKGSHQCALTRGGEVMCWGFNFYGGLGDDTNDKKSAPVAVVADHGETRALGVGNWRREYRCYGDDSCDFDRESFDVPMLGDPANGDPSGTDSTPAFTITNVKSFESVSLHSDGACTTTALASGRVANGSSSLSLTSSALAAVKNAVFVKRGDQCRPHRTDYTYESGTTRITGDAEGTDFTPALTINLLAASDTLSLHRSPDCTDSALASATATATSEEVTLASLGSPGIHHLYLKQNGVCHLHPFRYTLEGFQGRLARIDGGGFEASGTLYDGHTCVVTSGGGVKCWGHGGNGQLGNNATANSSSPVDVVGVGGTGTLANIVQVSAGSKHTCGVTSGGKVVCWGEGDSGRLGNNGTADSSTPVYVVASGSDTTNHLTGIVQVSAGGDVTCALTTAGGVKCWGFESHHQLGDGVCHSSSNCHTTSGHYKAYPVDVVTSGSGTSALRGAVYVSVGSAYSCALMSEGGVVCWGYEHAALGNGATIGVFPSTQSRPGDVVASGTDTTNALANIIQLYAGEESICATTAQDTVKCWGEGSDGQLGHNTTDDEDELLGAYLQGDRTYPVDVVTSSTDSNPLTNIQEVGVGALHSCALVKGGTVKCWGKGQYGALGNDGTDNKNYPVTVVDGDGSSTALTGIAEITGGTQFTCAVTTTGGVKCWGHGANGKLGNKATTNKDHPVDVVTSSSNNANLNIGSTERTYSCGNGTCQIDP